MSGLGPRLAGIGFKRVPEFGFLWIVVHTMGEEKPSMSSATLSSICAAYFINPVRMIEKQQRAGLRINGVSKPVMEIIREARIDNYKPLFRGMTPLIGHTLVGASTGLIGQPKLQKRIHEMLEDPDDRHKIFSFSKSGANLAASMITSPIYVLLTHPLSRLEVIMQTSPIKEKRIGIFEATRELITDSKKFDIKGMFRGQGIGIVKAIIALSLFHEGRMMVETSFKKYNTLKL